MIIQKYIERPLLIYKRKFDIRVWVLVSSTGKCYFFKEGYLRTSGSEFKLDGNNPDNQYVHLTNNAIQKNSKTYGEFEDGNQLSFDRLQEYIGIQKIIATTPKNYCDYEKKLLRPSKKLLRPSKKLLRLRKKIIATMQKNYCDLPRKCCDLPKNYRDLPKNYCDHPKFLHQ